MIPRGNIYWGLFLGEIGDDGLSTLFKMFAFDNMYLFGGSVILVVHVSVHIDLDQLEVEASL